MLSAAKHLAAQRARPFAEFTLSKANVLRVTLCDCSNCQGLFFIIVPCLMNSSIQKEKAVQFRRFHQEAPLLVLLNVWDAASARIIEQAGFRAIATTSSGVAAAWVIAMVNT